MSRIYFAYILTNKSRRLYTGVTNDLKRRMFEHKNRLVQGFTHKYNLDRLVWYEEFGDVRNAISREKEIRGWLRKRKIALIESVNPEWQDLSHGYF